MPEVKNVSVAEEADKEYPEFIPSDKEINVVSSTFLKFTNSATERNRNFQNFDGLNLVDYIEDSYRRYTTNIDIRDDIEDWQSVVHDPFTRTKVLAVLGQIVKTMPVAEFVGRGDEDFVRGQIMTSMNEFSEEMEDAETLVVSALEEAIVKGTVVVYEGHENKERTLRDIKGTNDEISFLETKETTNKLFSEIVRLEDFYPSSVGISDIKKMPYCFRRRIIPFQHFLQDYAMFNKSSYVKPNQTVEKDTEKPYYLDYISDDVVNNGDVEIIYYYNRDVDEYIIIANGVWLNPIIQKEKEIISPIPFNHKELPFWSFKFESFGGDFFYGKSLPDKLKTLQDVLNVLTNMLLDQSFLTIFPPLLTNGFDSIEDDYLRPGRRTPIDTQGLSIRDSFMKLDLGTPGNWHQFILNYTRGIMEEASVDKVTQGTAGAGDRTTAQEIRVAAEGVTAMLSLFGRYIKSGLKRKALLRGKNILQFWTNKKTPIMKKLFGEDGNKEFNEAFNTIKLDNTTMSNGKRGRKVIEIYSSKKHLPTKNELKARAKIFKIQTGKDVEIVAIPASYLRDFEFDVKVVINPRSEHTRDMEKALQLEKVKVYLSFFPQQVDINELAAQTAEKMGDDPTKIFKNEIFQNEQNQQTKENPTGQNQTMSQKPEMNLAENAVKGARGGEQNSVMLRDLQNQLK